MIPSYVIPTVRDLLEQHADTGCWVWTGELSDSGYGIAVRRRRRVRVHRWVWAMSGRAIPDGHDLDHVCRVRCCANPAHLIPRPHDVHGRLSAEQQRNLQAWEDGA